MGYNKDYMFDGIDDVCQYYQNGIMEVTGKISGLTGSLRTDALFGKRTNDNAEEIIGYLEMISKSLEALE
jgi:hypothetical protein